MSGRDARVPRLRYAVSIEIYDNATGEYVTYDVGNHMVLQTVEESLRSAVRDVEVEARAIAKAREAS